MILRLYRLKYLITNYLNFVLMESKALKQRYRWHAPEGYWYTQRTVNSELERRFTPEVCGKTENTILNWVLWTDAEKLEWEELWLTEPEGE